MLTDTNPNPHFARVDPRPKAIVIGSGFGGLAAAVRLSAKGYNVTVVEKLDAPGGRAYVYHQDGFTFDAGPTLITAPYIFEELWEAAGGRLADDVKIKPCDPYYKIRFDDGEVFTYCGDYARMREEVRRLSPGDVDGYDRFLEKSEEIYDIAFAQLADKPFHSLVFTLKTMADLIRLGGYWSVYQKVCQYFSDPNLRMVFSFHPLFIGGNPFTTTSFYCLIAHLERAFGVHYAVGGTNALITGLVNLLQRNGGTLRCNSGVRRILTEGERVKGVELETGEQLLADIVVSNVDPATTYGHLLKAHKRKRWTDRKIENSDYSMSLFVWYFGTNRTFDDIAHHTIALGPRYRGLLDDIFKKQVVTEDFSLYLHRPTASDPSLAPPGCDAFYVLSPVPNLGSGDDWTQLAEPYRQRIETRLEETLLPGLGASIVTSRCLTPLDFRDRLSSFRGAAFSLEPKLFQSAWFRPHNLSEEVEGLYLVGAGTHPGAGVPSVLTSAKLVAGLIPDAADVSSAKRGESTGAKV